MVGSPRGDGLGSRFLARDRVLVGAFLLARLFSASGAAAQDPCAPPAGDTGFAEVSVNLNAGTFNQVLPFDVPVRVCGTVPAGTTSVAVQYVASKTADLSIDQNCKVLAPPGAQLQPATPIPARLDGTTVRVILPPLEAERYYAFCFERRAQVPEGVAARFKMNARDVLDRGFAQVGTGNLSPEQSRQLRNELYQELLEATGADIAIVQGTVFDTGTEYDELRGKFRDQVQKILAPQRRRDRIVEGNPSQGLPSLSEQQRDFNEALNAVHDSPPLAGLAAQLEKNAQADPTLQAMLAGKNLSAALALTRADDDQLALIAQGREPGEAPPDLTSPDQAVTMASRYDDSSAALGSLASLIRKVVDAPAASNLRAGLSADDIAALRGLIDPASGPLAKANNLAFTLSGLAQDLQTSLVERSAALDSLADKVRIEAAGVQVVDGSTTGNFATSQSNYISADAGLVFAPELSTGVSYVGVNFYFRPVNKNADLSQFGSFSRRFALTLGLTVQSLADGGSGVAQTRDNLFGNQSLILGGGLRVTNSLRVGTGAVVFKERDPNPLVGKYSLTTTYYFTLSFDLNVARVFQGGLGSLFGG
ncbi:MAG TPA: hypothetical protein VLB76_04200 [Thermoanaerobaculia bacterium]|jgi:hypothetical protein|nr:hypothetical protein [Thermoanaerobaculia bacterium]